MDPWNAEPWVVFFIGGTMDYRGNDNSYTLAILVNNTSGVLMRVVSLFSRRGYNIDSLSVGETETPERSRITIVVRGDRKIVEQIIRQVEKLVDVICVYEMRPSESFSSELLMVKIKADGGSRSDLIGLGDIFKARIVDVTPETVTFMITGNWSKIESFLDMISQYGIVELSRTGMTAIGRGAKSLAEISTGDEK